MKRNAWRWVAPLFILLLCCGAALAARPSWVKVSGTAWRVSLSVSADLGGSLGDYSWDDVDGVFTFGPKGRIGKSKFTWKSAEDDFEADVSGSFKPEKNKVKLSVSSSQWNSLIKAVFRSVADEEDVEMDNLSVKFRRMTVLDAETGRDSDGEWIEFQMRGEFEYSFKSEGERFKGTGSFEIEGTGRR